MKRWNEDLIELKQNENIEHDVLLIPVFKTSEKKIYEEADPQKFFVPKPLFSAIKEYFTSTDERIIIVQNDIDLKLLNHVKMFSRMRKKCKNTTK